MRQFETTFSSNLKSLNNCSVKIGTKNVYIAKTAMQVDLHIAKEIGHGMFSC